MDGSVGRTERQRSALCSLAEELVRRQLPRASGWSHNGAQIAAEPTALALLALRSSTWASIAKEQGFTALMSRRLSCGLWPAVEYSKGANFWTTAIAVNALMILDAEPETLASSVDALVHGQPLEASWLVRMKFRFADQHVRFDPTKYGWPWVPDTVSWVMPTSMTMITLERAKRQGLADGSEIDNRLRLGTEMLLDRACTGGGWNAGNAFVYGIPLRPQIDATAIALAALRPHYQQPIIRNSLAWLLSCVECPSPYSLAWLILAVSTYREVRSDITPALAAARDRLAALVDDPQGIQDTSTVALAALALGVGPANNPFEVNR
jgi:hypothetical protein